jgi:hypothetical protein
VLTAIDGSHNQSILVKDVAVKLAGIGKLEDTLTNLGSRTVNLIKEEDAGVFTSRLEPVGRIE